MSSERSFLLVLTLLALAPLAQASSLFPLAPASNTVYQNTNSTPLEIYSIAISSSLSGYMGANSQTMNMIIESRGGSVTVTSVVYQLAGYNLSAVMIVPPNWFYKFNYTSASFYGEYITQNQAGATSQVLLLPESGTQQYAGGALILFALGLVLFISLLIFTLIGVPMPLSNDPKVNMLIMMVMSLATLVVLVFSAFYQVQITTQSYTILSGNSPLTVQQSSVLSQPLATSPLFGPLITLMATVSAIMALVLPAAYVLLMHGRKKYGVGR